MLNFGKVLVTGGAGFIGSHLVDALVKEGCGVSVLDNLSTGRVGNIGQHLGGGGLRFVEGDLRDRRAVDGAVKGVEAVLHLAAVTSVPYSIRNPGVTFEVNVTGTMNLLEACLRGDVERFLYLSTCAVYGEAKYLPIDEKHPTGPISPYAESKLAAEHLCRKFQRENGLKVAILRVFNVYGPRQQNNDYAGVIERFIERLRGGNPPIICGDGEQTRDFVYVEDVIQAMMLALNGDNSVGRMFNIGTGVPTTINHLAQLLTRMVGVRGVEPQHQGYRQGDIRHSYADISEAKTHLGYAPRISLKEGLSTLVENSVR